MKIIRSLLVVASFAFLISCGSKAPVEEACLCSKLSEGLNDNAKGNGIYSYQGQPYTGICKTKDQYDTIIERNEYKNGFVISSYKREKIGNIYVTKDSMTYDNGKEFNGFKIWHDSRFDFEYVKDVTDMKNGVDEGGSITVYTDYGFSVYYTSANGKTEFNETMNGSAEEIKPKFKAFLDKVHEANSHFTYY
jgi:hypothetical protein